MDFFTRNSSVVSSNAAISCDQPQATRIGIDILRMGGNAADAAVATFAAVSVIQPMTGGIGGDCHCLFYRNSDKSVLSINGSGRTGKEATLEKVKAAGITDFDKNEFRNHGLCVSVPGAVAGIFNIVKHFGSGKLTMSQLLEPAINLAENGVPVPYKTAMLWNRFQNVYMASKHAKDLVNDKKPPSPGGLLFAPKLAKCLKDIAESGAEAFYTGDMASKIVEEVRGNGGLLTVNDLKNHLKLSSASMPSDAFYISFHGFRIWEMKPNPMGVVALVALNTLKFYDLEGLGHNSPEYIHLVAEAIKFSYLECWEFLCDPDYSTKSADTLLQDDIAKKIKNKIDMERAIKCDILFAGDNNTSYVAVVDREGNGCSFIYSVSTIFGSGIIPKDCGFVLHDRAKCMSLDEKSPNAYGPNKLPLHTIIPSLITDDKTNDLLGVFGVIGRWMQPQGHVQVVLNMIVFGMDPQTALHQPRFFVGNPDVYMEYKNSLNSLCLEEGIHPSVVDFLKNKGHNGCEFYSDCQRGMFGKGHIIARSDVFNKGCFRNERTWWAGADPRSDGCAMGF